MNCALLVFHPEDLDDTFLRNVGLRTDYTGYNPEVGNIHNSRSEELKI
jgi:hypothetical protein